MRILGIDPGLRLTGYACVDGPEPGARLVEAGVIRLKAPGRGMGVASRLAELDDDVRAVLERLGPAVVAVESLFAHYKHPATAIAMGHARGVILLAAHRAGAEIVELKPNEIKKFLTGHGHASKAQVQESVRARLGLAARPKPPDVADAIAIALCAAWRRGSALRVGGTAGNPSRAPGRA